MEYCDSGDLATIIKKPMKEKWVQFYFSQLTNGLQYLEDHDIMHRDIKPKNILLTDNKKILKIADFGFAVQLTLDKQQRNTVVGTPYWFIF